MSLHGKRIVITRAVHQADDMADLLRDTYDAIPVIYPCIDIAPPTDTTELDNALQNLSTYDWLILTSRNTVRMLAKRITELGIKPDFPKIAVVGSSTAELTQALLGIEPDFTPEDFVGSALADELTIRNDEHILLPQSAKADDTLADALRAKTAQVTVITAYENVIGIGGDDVTVMLANDQIDALTFMSGSTIEGFVERTKPFDATHLPVACIGTSTAKVAHEYGFQHLIVPETFTIKVMLDALSTYFAQHQLERD